MSGEMFFVNTTGKDVIEFGGEDNGIIKFIDHTKGSQLPVKMAVNTSDRTLHVFDDDYAVFASDLFVESQYEEDSTVWFLSDSIGFASDHTVYLTVIPLGEYFLFAVHKGVVSLKVDGEDFPIAQNYSGSASSFRYHTPSSMPGAPWKARSAKGFDLFRFAYKFKYWGPEDGQSSEWGTGVSLRESLNKPYQEELKANRRYAEYMAQKAKDEEAARAEMKARSYAAERGRRLLASLAKAQ